MYSINKFPAKDKLKDQTVLEKPWQWIWRQFLRTGQSVVFVLLPVWLGQQFDGHTHWQDLYFTNDKKIMITGKWDWRLTWRFLYVFGRSRGETSALRLVVLIEVFSGFLQSLEAHSRIVHETESPPLPFRAFQVHYSLIVPFDSK
jgi:hypothetical protein